MISVSDMLVVYKNVFDFFFLRLYLFIFRERGREGEREGGKDQCVVASRVRPSPGPGQKSRHVP